LTGEGDWVRPGTIWSGGDLRLIDRLTNLGDPDYDLPLLMGEEIKEGNQVSEPNEQERSPRSTQKTNRLW